MKIVLKVTVHNQVNPLFLDLWWECWLAVQGAGSRANFSTHGQEAKEKDEGTGSLTPLCGHAPSDLRISH